MCRDFGKTKIAAQEGVRENIIYSSRPVQCIAREGSRPLLSISSIRAGDDIVLEALAPHSPERLLQANIHIVQPGGHTDGEYAHEGEDLGYVLEGELELVINGKTHVLKAGDSFLFRSESKHSYTNPGKTVTKVLWVNTPPSF